MGDHLGHALGTRSGPSGVLVRLADRLPAWTGSIKVRLAFLYTAVVFGLFALVVVGIYGALSWELSRQSVTTTVQGEQACFRVGPSVYCLQSPDLEVRDPVKEIEKSVNQRALDQFRRLGFLALGGLFFVSVGVGWVLADRALAPIGRISRVAKRIQATDLSQRINLTGPEDEIKELADTFDGMLGRLEAAWESQRGFIHEASHELRNPIAVIRTNVDVALADPDTSAEELRDSLAVVGNAAQRMGVLVDDLLTYARREAPADREGLVDVGELVLRTAVQFDAPATARRLTLLRHAPARLYTHGDPVALEQALANLLANATRLAPEGTTVTVSAGQQGPWVWLAVTDEGPGIPVADQPKVYERFWRGEKHRARTEGRSGLGLTIVRQIARGHGGSVALQSEPGKGSTFSIWLPAAEVDEVPATRSERADERSLVPGPTAR